MKKHLPILLLLPVVAFFSCTHVAKYPMDEPMAELVFDGIKGTWKAEEDTDKNNIIVITKATDSYKYDLKYWEKGGTNPKYESQVHFSKINDALFLNVACWDDLRYNSYYQMVGYAFFKVVYATPDFSKMALAHVVDPELEHMTTTLEIFNRMARNLNNKAYYKDTIHLYKVQ